MATVKLKTCEQLVAEGYVQRKDGSLYNRKSKHIIYPEMLQYLGTVVVIEATGLYNHTFMRFQNVYKVRGDKHKWQGWYWPDSCVAVFDAQYLGPECSCFWRRHPLYCKCPMVIAS